MATRFPFIDADHAAELLGVARSDILTWVSEGRLASYGGKDRNPFLRTADVEQLAAELNIPAAQPGSPKGRARSPTRRVQLRLNADARWSETSEDDIRQWARDLDDTARAAAAKVADSAIARLQAVLRAVERTDL